MSTTTDETRIASIAAMSARLIGQLGGFAIKGVEGSFKMSRSGLRTNRLMIGVERAGHSDEAILDALAPLGVPSEHLLTIRRDLPRANLVLYGFEDGASDCTYKFYLEFWDRVVEAVAAGDLSRRLLHLGYKWSASTGAKIATTRYHCEPGLSAGEVLDRVRGFHARPDPGELRSAVEGILLAATARTGTFLYLEGDEEGSPRKSYDVNVYNADLRVRDVRDELEAACASFTQSAGELDKLLAKIADRALGHISGGTDRNGGEFLTVYYDAE